MKIPHVSHATWKTLYEASMAFRDAAPWLRLMDTQLFAVVNPVDGELGYCCVMGAVGKLRALGLYRGDSGLRSYLDLLQQDASSHPDDFAGSQDALMAEWTDKEFVETPDRRVIHALGLKFRGPSGWPVFRSYVPRYAPWHVSEEEAAFLTLGLRAAVDVDRLVRGGLQLPEAPGRLFTLTPAAKGFSTEWREMRRPVRPSMEPVLPDPAKVRALKENKAKRVGAWEADVFNQTAIIQDRERPYIFRSAMAADQDSGLILQFKGIAPTEADSRILSDLLLEVMIEQRAVPVALIVRQPVLAAGLEPLGAALDIRIQTKKRLPAVERARKGLEQMQSGGDVMDDEPPASRADPRALERLTSDLFRAVQDSGASTQTELDAILKSFNAGEQKTLEPRTPVEAAQNLMYEAWEAPTTEARVKLAKRALKQSPDCADAYVLLAEETARTNEEALLLYQKGREAGERALGAPFFAENVGHFWGVVESRPYMRALEGVARSLFHLGRKEEAFALWREMLRLNTHDNQGIRYVLSAELANAQRWTELSQWMDGAYPDDAAAEWLYAKALLRFAQAGDVPPARQALRQAFAANRFVPDYLAGRKSFPDHLPDRITLGGDDEACAAADLQLTAWRQTPGALEWLNAQTAVQRAAAKTGRNDPCPCGSGGKFKKCCGA